MKYTTKDAILLLLAIGVFTVLPVMNLIAAGPPGPPGGGGDPPCWPAPCVPIDGGLGFLIAAGLAYGGKKTYNSLKGKD